MPLRNIKDKLTKISDDEWLGQKRDADYLASMDIDPKIEPVLTIDGIYYGEVSLKRGKESKYVLSFKEESVPGILVVRPMICNATNKKALKKMYGGLKNSDLIGKRVQLYIDHKCRNPEDGGFTDGIRIRDTVPKEAQPSEPALICELCGKEITPAHGMDAKKLAEYTFSKYNKQICAECATDLSKVQSGAEK